MKKRAPNTQKQIWIYINIVTFAFAMQCLPNRQQSHETAEENIKKQPEVTQTGQDNAGEDMKKRPEVTQTGGSYNYTNKNAPKTIKSKTINKFEYKFNAFDLNYSYARNIPYEYCNFSITRENDHALCKGRGHGTRYAGEEASYNFEFKTHLSSLDKLQSIIDEHNIARVNGIHRGAIGMVLP